MKKLPILNTGILRISIRYKINSLYTRQFIGAFCFQASEGEVAATERSEEVPVVWPDQQTVAITLSLKQRRAGFVDNFLRHWVAFRTHPRITPSGNYF